MAEAFGGKVVKSDKGWGVGLHAYDVAEAQPGWTGREGGRARLAPGPGGRHPADRPAVAGSAFTPAGVLVYDDRPAISMQFHPEFEPAYARALIESRRGSRFTDAEADAAIASLGRANDRAGWQTGSGLSRPDRLNSRNLDWRSGRSG